MSLDLDDLIEDDALDPMDQPKEFVTGTVVVDAPTAITYDLDEEVGVITLPTPAFVTSMVVHGQHLYIATANGRVFRSEVRFRDKRNKWDEVSLPEEM